MWAHHARFTSFTSCAGFRAGGGAAPRALAPPPPPPAAAAQRAWGGPPSFHLARGAAAAAAAAGQSAGAAAAPPAAATAPAAAAEGEDGGYDSAEDDGPYAARDDTIAAIATGTGGAVAIVRLSGADAVAVAGRVFRPSGGGKGSKQARGTECWAPESHRVYHGRAVDPRTGAVLDEVLALVMRGPRSYTAEDVVELHAHGGGVCAPRVLAAALAAGARLAAPGEFTLRAFLSGRLDLAQAEAVAALVGARSPAAADCALAGLAGGPGAEVRAARAEALALLAEIDARLDFDEDLPEITAEALAARVRALRDALAAAAAGARAGAALARGLQVALVGRPNVGKSSLLNALCGHERAIVTPVAGTTRDVVEASAILGPAGVPVTLLDTAGVRDTADAVEAIGVARSLAAARDADVVAVVADAAAARVDPGDAEFLAGLGAEGGGGSGAGSSAAARPPLVLVLNKDDLAAGGDRAAQDAAWAAAAAAAGLAFAAVVRTSAATGAGLDALRGAVLDAAAAAPGLAPGGRAWAVSARQGEALERAAAAAAAAADTAAQGLPLDFWTVDLRDAALALGEVSGEEVSEEVLTRIFSTFCIGK